MKSIEEQLREQGASLSEWEIKSRADAIRKNRESVMPDIEKHFDTWPRPIPVSEKLPDPGETVLAFMSELRGGAGRYWYLAQISDSGQWIEIPSAIAADVTHWLPLPGDPKKSI